MSNPFPVEKLCAACRTCVLEHALSALATPMALPMVVPAPPVPVATPMTVLPPISSLTSAVPVPEAVAMTASSSTSGATKRLASEALPEAVAVPKARYDNVTDKQIEKRKAEYDWFQEVEGMPGMYNCSKCHKKNEARWIKNSCTVVNLRRHACDKHGDN